MGPSIGREDTELRAASLLIGTYTTGRGAAGLYRAELGSDDSVRLRTSLALRDPSFVARHPERALGYVTGELPDAPGTLTRIALSGDDDAAQVLDTVPAAGHLPCHAAVTRDGRHLWVACYGSGTVSVWRLDPDGALTGSPEVLRHTGRSAHPRRQDAPHPHAVVMHPNGRDVYVTDLGTDRIEHYRHGPGARIERRAGYTVTPGAGPRHLAFDANGRRGALVNELDNTLVVLEVDGQGALRPTRRLPTLPPDFAGRSFASEIVLSPDGAIAFVGNRGHDSIARILLDGAPADRGWLPSRGHHPRHFALSPDALRVVIGNRDSDSVACYRLDAPWGQPAGDAVVSAVPTPAFLLWL
jgi:6-phosphogluconolactonase